MRVNLGVEGRVGGGDRFCKGLLKAENVASLRNRKVTLVGV